MMNTEHAQTPARTFNSEFPPFPEAHKHIRSVFPELVGRSTFLSQYVGRDSHQNTDTFNPCVQPANSQPEMFPISLAQLLTFMQSHSHTTSSKNYIFNIHYDGRYQEEKSYKQKKKNKIASVSKDVEKLGPCTLLVGM